MSNTPTNIITIGGRSLTIRDLDEVNKTAWVDFHGDEPGRLRIIQWITEFLTELGPDGSQTLSNVSRNLSVTQNGTAQYTLNGCYITEIQSIGDSADKKQVQSVKIAYSSKV